MVLLKTGAVYSILYSNWKTNPTRIYPFILYSGPSKIHAINIGARQLTQMNRMKLIRVISQLSKLPMATKWNGRQLYAIFKRYAPDAIRQSYRTYWKTYVTTSALVNYGLNKKEEFLDIELKYVDKNLFNQAKKDMIVNTLNLFSKNGVNLSSVKDSYAKPPAAIPTSIGTKTNEQAPSTTEAPQTNETNSANSTPESGTSDGGDKGGPIGGSSSSVNIDY